jgi:hypothetical protein
VEGSPDEGYYDTRWLTGHWSTQAKVEGIMLQAVWHWGSDCSAVHDPLGKPGCTPLYAARPSVRVGLRRWGPYVLPVFRERAP